MDKNKPSILNMPQTWKYAFICGLASIPLTVGLYWRSGMGNEMSLNMVFFAGLLAGFLTKRRLTDGSNIGFRTGVIGGLPMLWLSFDWLRILTEPIDPAWFRIVGVVLIVGFIVISFFFAGFVGFLGSKAGRWLAVKTDQWRTSVTGS